MLAEESVTQLKKMGVVDHIHVETDIKLLKDKWYSNYTLQWWYQQGDNRKEYKCSDSKEVMEWLREHASKQLGIELDESKGWER